MNKYKLKKDNLALLISTVLLVIGFLILAILVIFRLTTKREATPLLSLGVNHIPEAVVKFEKGSLGRLYDKVIKRTGLSREDSLVKEKIISLLQGKAGIIMSSENVVLSYLPTPNIFQAEIKSYDDFSAKQEVVNWFLSQGLSRKGVCDLPVMFSLAPNIKEEFIKSRKEFSPLVPGC